MPAIPARDLSAQRLLKAIRRNALEIWPVRAYEQDYVTQTFFGRQRVLMNAPEGFEHVLVGNAANYRRSPATIRILRPSSAAGSFLSEGEDWSLQRRTIAPALAPRVIPLLPGHVTVRREALARLAAQTAGPSISWPPCSSWRWSRGPLHVLRRDDTAGAAMRAHDRRFRRAARPALSASTCCCRPGSRRSAIWRAGDSAASWTKLMDSVIADRQALAPAKRRATCSISCGRPAIPKRAKDSRRASCATRSRP